MPAIETLIKSVKMLTSKIGVPHNNPETNSNESPGKKNPKNKPVSANTTNSSKDKPP
jgi:hypothetical protein